MEQVINSALLILACSTRSAVLPETGKREREPGNRVAGELIVPEEDMSQQFHPLGTRRQRVHTLIKRRFISYTLFVFKSQICLYHFHCFLHLRDSRILSDSEFTLSFSIQRQTFRGRASCQGKNGRYLLRFPLLGLAFENREPAVH